MHAVPACYRTGSGDLNLKADPFPSALIYQSIPTLESVGRHCAEILPISSSVSDLLNTYVSSRLSSADSSTTAEELYYEELMGLISYKKAFENTSTSVAASQMRNALTALADTCKDPHEKEVSLPLWAARGPCMLTPPSFSILRWTTSSRSSGDT